MKCKHCNEIINENKPIQLYPEILHECQCGTVVDEKGSDKTEEYYSKEES